MRLDKDKIKESLTEEDVEKILVGLGSEESSRDIQGNLMFSTICHGGDSQKLYYYPESQNFFCYTECSKSMDIYQLIMEVDNTTFPQALRHVAQATGKRIVTERQNGFGLEKTKVDDWDWINKVTHRKPRMTDELPNYDEKILDIFMDSPHNSWLEEGITEEIIREAEIKWYFSQESIIIPHRDINNRLIGIRQRNTLQEDIDAGRKYIPVRIANGTMYNHTTAYNLYNLNRSKEAISKSRKIVIYEGEKSCLLNRVYYGDYDFSVAVCGSSISSHQVRQILSLGVEEVFIAFDKFRDKKADESEESYERQLNAYKDRLLRLANMFTPYSKTYILYDDFGIIEGNDAPVDGGKQKLEQLMKNKYEIRTKDVED